MFHITCPHTNFRLAQEDCFDSGKIPSRLPDSWPLPGAPTGHRNAHGIPMAQYPPRLCFLPTPCASTSLGFGRHPFQTHPMPLEVPQNSLTFFGTHPTLTWGEQEQVSVSRPSFPKAMLQRASHTKLARHLSSLLRKTKAGLRVPGKRGV